MYSSTYLTVRVHTKEEAEAVFPSETVDLMMWLIDVYDIQTGCAPAVHEVLLAKYHTEAERVPGILPKWTRTMMIWVTLLHCSVAAASAAASAALEWAAKHNFRINAEACEKWTVDDLLLALDALAQRWHQLSVNTELERHAVRQYLEVLFGLARKWTMHRHPRLTSMIGETSETSETSMTSMTSMSWHNFHPHPLNFVAGSFSYWPRMVKLCFHTLLCERLVLLSGSMVVFEGCHFFTASRIS